MAYDRVLVIGMNPSGFKAHKGTTLPRLRTWLQYIDVLEHDFINVSNEYGCGIKLDPDYNRVLEKCKDYDAVLALGNYVSKVLNRLGIQHFKLPHPSPRIRMINDPKKIESVLDECIEFMLYKN